VRVLRSADASSASFGAEAAVRADEASALRFGDYELLGELAHGGMGIVWRARQISLNRIVALKMILAGRFANESEVKRFRAEAEAAAQLDHPNIVPIYEVGEHEGQHFFAMKLMEGGSLAERLQPPRSADASSARTPGAATRGRGVRAPSAVARLVATVARAVHHAHQRGILHRDLKPGNILLDAAGEPHVTDFGLAKRLAPSPGGEGRGEGESAQLTLSGAILGTPAYMSPEAASGKARQLTTASDIYSLGAILYELLAGRPPFAGDSAVEVLRKVVEEEPVPPSRSADTSSARSSTGPLADEGSALHPSVDCDLEIICLKCLEKYPARRYSSAASLADDLERFLRHEPIRARPSTTRERFVKWARRNPVRAGFGAALVLVTLIGVAGIVWQWHRADVRAEESQDRLLRIHVLNAQQRLESGDPMAALPWLAAALAEETAGSHRREVYQTALANIVRRSPVPEHVWWMRGDGCRTALAPDGRQLVTADIGWHLWDTATGNALAGGDTAHRFGSVAFSPDGSRFAVGRHDATVLYSPTNGLMLAPLLPHTGWVTRVLFSPNGRWLVTMTPDDARIWSASSGEALSPELRHRGLYGLALHPNGTHLVTAGHDKFVRLWEAPSGRQIKEVSLDSSRECAFSPDGQWLLVGRSRPRSAVFLNATSLQQAGKALPHGNYVEYVAFSPDGALAATGSADQTARVWSVPGGDPITPPIALESECTTLRFSPDNKAIATASRDGRVKLWDARTAAPLTPWFRHGASVHELAFSPDGSHLFTASKDGAARMWIVHPPARSSLALLDGPALRSADASSARTESGERVDNNVAPSPHPSPPMGERVPEGRVRGQPRSEDVWHATFTPDRSRVIACGPRTARMYEVSSGTPVTPTLEHGQPVDQVELNRDGTLLLTICRDRQLRLWRLPSGELIRAWPVPDDLRGFAWLADSRRFGARTPRPREPSKGKQADEASALHGTFVTLSLAGPLEIWSTASNSPLLRLTDRLTDPHDKGQVLAVSPDRQRIAAGFVNKKLGLWTVDGKEVALVRPAGDVVQITFSRDGAFLATGDREGRCFFWRARDGQQLGSLMRHGGHVLDLAFSPDGRTLTTVSADGLVRQWSVPSGELAGPAFRPPPGTDRLRWSDDGHLLATVGTFHAQLWDAVSSAPITPQLHFEREIAGAVSTADGRRLLVVTEEGRLWQEWFDAPDWPEADWQFLARAISSQHVDKSGDAIPWRGLDDRASMADADALSARWQQLRPRLRELLR
jgi:WD40 repeat protein/serine/threonine protein kinase